MVREDDFQKKREHLKNMSEEELINYFWQLTEKIVDPLVELSKTHTSPSIERSVLLRMGFSSIESKNIVRYMVENNLLPHGAGKIVLIYSELKKKNYLDAGKDLSEGIGWEEVVNYYRRNQNAQER
ncbi:MAG TPA: ornithine aminomutase subunit alpha [Caldisericia bacterium]|nr:ornithine aminomutase subunit alpha [Caldisericia bacterium]HPB33391.1 ornithine aminomutase subunit alpha [Caldisericia bacterium]HQL66823.1 ornithine aminomutase subunit alpha [Caldisericia bacterium]HQN48028.1 ornithine aminomutase subunit alpha [Caldisericia bacterium]HQO99132.1 ornithine aminomutase subunit alpha [Caldisericia bacterium]